MNSWFKPKYKCPKKNYTSHYFKKVTSGHCKPLKPRCRLHSIIGPYLQLLKHVLCAWNSPTHQAFSLHGVPPRWKCLRYKCTVILQSQYHTNTASKDPTVALSNNGATWTCKSSMHTVWLQQPLCDYTCYTLVQVFVYRFSDELDIWTYSTWPF